MMRKYTVRPRERKLSLISYFRAKSLDTLKVSRVAAYRQTAEKSFPRADEYQQRVMELISSEETYLKLADKLFQRPLKKSNILTKEECDFLCLNLHELIEKSEELVKAFRVRLENTSLVVGDILCEHIPHLHPYVRFCNGQLYAFSLLQEKLNTNQEFKAFVNNCEKTNVFRGLPVSSYLINPMQRITKYPLLIEKIIQNTTERHPDRTNLTKALEKAEMLCTRVNEGLRRREETIKA